MCLKVTPATLTSWREEPCQVAKATLAIYDIRGLRPLVLRGLERVKFLSAKVNRNSTFSSLCLCSPGLGMKCKGLWWGTEWFGKRNECLWGSLPFSSPDSSVCSLSLSFGISLFWGFAQLYFCSAFFYKSPLLQGSLCIRHAVSFSHQRHLFPLITLSPLSPYQALYSSDLLQHSSFALHLPPLYHTHLILQFLPSPTLPLYSFHIAFSLDLLFRNILSFLSLFPSILLLSHFCFIPLVFY